MTYSRSVMNEGPYGDHITLPRIMELYHINCVIIVAAGAEFTTGLSTQGIWNDNLPSFVLGHFPEGIGEFLRLFEWTSECHKFSGTIAGRFRRT